jgi:intraflagellar transport protein 172
MYKDQKQYDQMIRLVAAFHKDLLDETHIFLAKTMEAEGRFKEAEQHFIDGKDWKSAISMYCANNAFEDAYRVRFLAGFS